LKNSGGEAKTAWGGEVGLDAWTKAKHRGGKKVRGGRASLGGLSSSPITDCKKSGREG